MKAHKVLRRGQVRWRVIVPKDVTGGKRREKFFIRQADARQWCLEAESARLGGMQDWLTLNPQDQVAVLHALKRAGSVEALGVAVEHWLRSQPSGQAVPVKNVAEECLASKRNAGCRARYLTQLGSTLRLFCSAMEGRAVGEIGTKDVETWLNGSGWAAATRRTYLTDITTLFSFCLKRGYLAQNPASAIDRPKFDDKPPGILTPGEARSLMDTAQKHDPRLCQWLAVQLFGGLRNSEACALMPEAVSKDYVTVTAEAAKTRKRRLVMVNLTLGAWLAIPGDLPPLNLVRRVRRIRKLAGIPWPANCLRHSFASYHLAAHQSADKTAHELGHASSQVLFQHYRELVTPEAAADFWLVIPLVATTEPDCQGNARRSAKSWP